MEDDVEANENDSADTVLNALRRVIERGNVCQSHIIVMVCIHTGGVAQ